MLSPAVERWRDLVVDELERGGSHLDPLLVLHLIAKESAGDPSAQVERGARATGLLQVTTAGPYPALGFYNAKNGTTISDEEFRANPRLQIRVGTWLLDHYRNQVDVQLFAGRRAAGPTAEVIRAELADHAYAEGMGTLVAAVKAWRQATGQQRTPSSSELQALNPADPPPWARNRVWRHRNQVVRATVAELLAAGHTLTWSPRTGMAPDPPGPNPEPPGPDPVPPTPPEPGEKKNRAFLIAGVVLGVAGVAALGWGLAHV